MDTLEITVNQDGAAAVITLVGRLDTTTAPLFEETADKTVSDGATDIVVDMTRCDYVSSAGLRVIIALQKRLISSGSLVFRGVQPDVMEVFDVTVFSTLLKFED